MSNGGDVAELEEGGGVLSVSSVGGQEDTMGKNGKKVEAVKFLRVCRVREGDGGLIVMNVMRERNDPCLSRFTVCELAQHLVDRLHMSLAIFRTHRRCDTTGVAKSRAHSRREDGNFKRLKARGCLQTNDGVNKSRHKALRR